MAVTHEPLRPVHIWAVIGAGVVALNIYVFGRYFWNLPDNIAAGPSQLPWYMAWSIRAQEIFLPLVVLTAIVRFIVRPLARRMPLPWDGLMIGALLLAVWQNYLVNMTFMVSVYNSFAINRGSWYQYVPLYQPDARGFAEAPLLTFGILGLWALSVIWVCFVMRQVQRRWPGLSNGKMMVVMFAFCSVFLMCAELIWLRTGTYIYPGAVDNWLTLFRGHYYQLPLYEVPLFGICTALFVGVRFWRNDRGESIAERGLSQIRVSQKRKTVLRFLALTGVFNVILFVTFNLPWALIAQRYHSSWPEDVQKRSYFVQQICGPKVGKACPGPGIPRESVDGTYMTEDGGLSHPPDWIAPVPVPFDNP